MIARDVIHASHVRAVANRRQVRHLLLNVTTVECAIWRGYRVGIIKHDNTNHIRPHFLYRFVVFGDSLWRSVTWQVFHEPTRINGKRTQERRKAAIAEAVNHLLTLEERAADRCERCDKVITRPGSRVHFCCEACQKQRGNEMARRRERR